MEKHVIIGTAGHVDHGKTTLIRALTGIDTDRLKEEKERGMTIDLGFASFTLPGGRRVGIVDVPGHERFLKNMLAGATGVDLVLLVVAADEGVMPQTREHLEILELLEAKKGVIALTKCDMVDDEWLEVVQDDIRQAFAGTFLEKAPIIAVSGTTGAGIGDLGKQLAAMVEEIEERSASGPFRLPVDRVFTLTGFGTVVTGTLVSGTIHVGDAVEVLPEGLQTRVRQLQVHGARQEQAVAGTRVAVNLVGVEVEDLQRGSVIAPPGYLRASQLIDTTIRLLPTASAPLRSRTRIRLHIGTTEALGRLKILDKEEIAPGEEGLAQFVAEQPLVSSRSDRFVIRSYSPMHTIGGGIVLDANAPRRKRYDQKSIDALKTRLQGVPADMVEDILLTTTSGVAVKNIAASTGLEQQLVTDVLTKLAAKGRARKLGTEKWIHETLYSQIIGRVENTLRTYHDTHPFKSGMPREDLRITAARTLDARTFAVILSALELNGQISCGENTVRLASHEVKLGESEQSIADKIESMYKSAGMNVPTQEEAISVCGNLAKEMFSLLVERGKLMKIDEGLYFHAELIAKAQSALEQHLKSNGKITVSEFRDLIGSSRKYVVPLLEYFDSKRITRRVGDARVLAKSSTQ